MNKGKLIDVVGTAIDCLHCVANLWHDGYVDLLDSHTIWAINEQYLTVGQVRRARLALGLPITRQKND